MSTFSKSSARRCVCFLGWRPLLVAWIALLICSPAVYAQREPVATDENWIQLFNGKDLNDWTPKFTNHDLGVNFRNTFLVEDGLLKVSYQNWEKFDGEFGHLFYKAPFSSYRLRVEYRFTGEQIAGGPNWAFRNNGLMVLGQDPKTMAKEAKFPNSIEVQLLGRKPGGVGIMQVCTPGTQVVIDGKLEKKHCIPSTGPTVYGDDWVTVEIEVIGGKSIKHIYDGKVIHHYTQPQLDDGTILTTGTISIQAETHPTEFRKIELLEIK